MLRDYPGVTAHAIAPRSRKKADDHWRVGDCSVLIVSDLALRRTNHQPSALAASSRIKCLSRRRQPMGDVQAYRARVVTEGLTTVGTPG
jgi:hypothetical protein